uniref:Calx-beta domain-containing protein n=1 Tax=uncultured Maribacter sp. TaxID=431308 RepID=UPI00260ABE94
MIQFYFRNKLKPVLYCILQASIFIAILTSGNKLAAQVTFNDEFNNSTYSNNDGSNTFSSNWIENDSNGGGATSGNISISNGNLTFNNIQSTGEIYRNLNLGTATSATLSISYNSASRGNEELIIQLRNSSGVWVEWHRVTGSYTSSTTTRTLESQFIHSNSGIRFVSGSGSWGSTNHIDMRYVRFSTNISNSSTDAEIKRPFAPRYSTSLNGDFTFIANTTIGTHPTTPYNGNGGNSTITTEFIDIDSDPTTFNSSNAVLNNPELSTACLNYKKVFLYWAASNKEYSANTGDGGSEPVWDFDQVKIQLPGTSSYQTMTADEVIYNGRAEHFENDPIILFKDITDDVNALASPYGTYQVANVKGAEGVLQSHSGSNTGTSGGWQVVFVYESYDLPPKNITLFDGYAHVTGTENILDIDFDGFQTIPTGNVKADVIIGALEGDREITGDELQILDTANNWTSLSTTERPSNNFFNSKITIDDAQFMSRTPASTNTLGFDASIFELDNSGNILIGNNQTAATMRITSNQESYGIYLLGLSIEIYEPNLGSFQLETSSTTTNVAPGSTIPLTLNFENFGNDNIENLEVTLVFPDQLDFTALTDFPVGTTSSYDAPTRKLTIQIPDGISDINDPAYQIDFDVQVVSPCTNCSLNTGIQALASYDGNINPENRSTLSSGSLENCGFGNNDPLQFSILPSVSINDASADEGNDMTFTISTTHTYETDITFNLNYTNNTTTNADYTGPTTVVLPAGSNTVDFNVTAEEDTILESNETFNVVISTSTSSVNITDSTGIGTINDDDNATIALSATNATEGNDIIFTATLSTVNNTGTAITVDFADLTTGSATSGTDYTSIPSNATITIASGDSTGTINVPTTQDTIIEGNETVIAQITNVSNSTITFGTDTATATINDDDSTGTEGLSIVQTDVVVTEGVGVTATFDVTLTG